MLVKTQGDPRTCGFIRSEAQYEKYLHSLEDKQIDIIDEGRRFGTVKPEQELELWNMKQQLGVIQPELESLRMQNGKKNLVIDTSVVVVVWIGLVIGMFVTTLWK